MSTFDAVAIRDEIKKERLKQRLSQKELASMCDKITNTDISAYEKGDKNPSLEKLEIIAKALGKEWKLK